MRPRLNSRNAWYDSSGNEADDKCARTGFTENGYGYQPEWSNAISGCKTV